MRIGIDARWIFEEISGIGAYTRELIRHLAAADSTNTYLLFFDNPRVMDRTVAETGLGRAANFSTRLLPFGVFSLMGQLRFPGIIAASKLDIYHSTNYMIPILAFPRTTRPGRTKCIVTIHDVIPMIFPNHAPKSRKARLFPIYRRLMIEIGRRANFIITDSEASRRDVISHLRIPENNSSKVRPVYCGVSPRFTPPATGRRPGDSGNDRKQTLLYVGRSDPYKNLATLVKALSLAAKQCRFPLELLIAGPLDSRYPEIGNLVSELGLVNSVRWTGYISDEELVKTYQTADLLVHPSRYEGFGLQVVEAMACGVPVICSNAGSLPEVAGQAAITLAPDDLTGFASKIRDVLTNTTLAQNLSRKGLGQAAKFSWTRTARETLAIYSEVARA